MTLADVETPVISGGDRHGCEPNGVINLTAARTFSEFAQEVRSIASPSSFSFVSINDPCSRENSRWSGMCSETSENLIGSQKLE